ncbi:MAG: hypothetical protein ABIS69_06785 [Sediminibacterium sp.]
MKPSLSMTRMKCMVTLLLFLPLFSFAIKITIIEKNIDQSLQYCKGELQLFLNTKNGFAYTSQQQNADWVITLSRNPKLKEAVFCVTSISKNGRQYIELSGANVSSVLCAVYTLLEKLGYTFEITGYQQPQKMNASSIKNYVDTIVPVAKFRGIRQHINFPMDISSYSLEDAKKYIRNLARMRFNFITFHSYPGQWYEVKQKDTIVPAGGFFYGHRHTIPNDPFFQKNINNKSIFVIPAIEPFFDSIHIKSKMAVQWLQEVMKESKRVGMKVQLSFEPRSTSTKVDSTISVIQQLQQQFPMVDAIEIMTEEAGGWGPVNTAAETKNYLVSFFGKQVLEDTLITNYILPKQGDLGYLYAQIGHAIKVINTCKERNIRTVELKMGIYCDSKYNIPSYYLAKKYTSSTEIAIMPSHGSVGVAKHIPSLMKEASDWDRTVIYSWLEFDGMMFLQQNGIEGIYRLLKYREESFVNKQIDVIAFNHWRTAENKITARYAALSTLFGAINPANFYREYAQRMGIALPDTFAIAMLKLEQAYDYKTSNMGFAWLGYWENGAKFESTPELQTQLALYKVARNELGKCAAGNKNRYARNTVEFLDNRLRTTLIYIQAYLKQNELLAEGLSNEKYAAVCNEVLTVYNEYLKVHAAMMPDRGCEGTLINLYLGPMRAVRISRLKRTGIPMEKIPKMNKYIDSPAPPIFYGG